MMGDKTKLKAMMQQIADAGDEEMILRRVCNWIACQRIDHTNEY